MTARQDRAVAKLREAAAELARAERAAARVRRRRDAWLVKAVEAGVSTRAAARAAKVAPSRVTAIAPRPDSVPARVRAGIQGAGVSGDAAAATAAATVPTIGDTPVGLSGLVSTRRVTRYGKASLWWDVRTGRAVDDAGRTFGITTHHEPGSVASILTVLMAAPAVTRVFLVGPPPVDAEGRGGANATRAWALDAALPAGWTVSARGHYLADADLPVLRFEHEAGRRVTILRAAAWWGESDADVSTCRDAWRGLSAHLARRFAMPEGLPDTPAAAGRGLWLRTVPEGAGFPVMSDELRELIHATAGQGRSELRPAPAGRRQLDGFTYLDGRLMYAALTWGMPVGEPRRWTREQVAELDTASFAATMRGRGRWRITAQVPHHWDHVGILMAPAGAAGWRYPAKPGERFDTWADGSEVWLALSQGWPVTVHEGISWAEGRPLTVWRDRLVEVWTHCTEAGTMPAAALAARAVRAMLLYSVGAFAGRGQLVTGSCPLATPERVPADAVPGSVTVAGDSIVWQQRTAGSAWSASVMHPEWAATVWARARVRLLDAPGAGAGERVGALHLPVGDVVAFATDALYLAGGPPAWSDDGKPGRFRVKGIRPGVAKWPADRAALWRLRDQAEAAGPGDSFSEGESAQ